MKLNPAQIRRYFESRLQGQRIASGVQATVRCPFHDDRTPSMSVNFEKGVWTCHSGCGSGGVVDFEQRFMKCDPETARASIQNLLGERQSSLVKRKPMAVYAYQDPFGKTVAEKLRFTRDDGSKYFQWRRPQKGGWEYRLDGFRPPLYQLPELIRSTQVVVVEGEKCADRVREALKDKSDLAVTTSPDGAASPGQAPKWSDDYSQYFKGKQVAILPDNDQPGRAHAEAVASAIHAYAAGVKVVHLPGLEEHADVYDYLESRTPEDLFNAIRQAPQWRPTSAAKDFFVGAMRFAATVPDEIDWAVKPIIPRGWNGFVIADPKSLKSYSILDLLISLSLGLNWLGFEVPRRMRTAILAREDYYGLTAWRIKHFLRGKPINAALLEDLDEWMKVNTRAQQATWALDNDEDLRLLVDRLKAAKTEFLAMDVFRRLHFADENDNTEMQQILDRVTRIQGEVGCSIGIVHHANKAGQGSVFHRTRGASVIHGWMEWGIGLTTINEEAPPRERIRKMEFQTKAGCEPDPIYVRAEGGEDVGLIRLARLRADELPGAEVKRIA